MYCTNVEIFVNGRNIIISVPCTPDTPENILKKKAIDMYIADLRYKLYKENNIEKE